MQRSRRIWPKHVAASSESMSFGEDLSTCQPAPAVEFTPIEAEASSTTTALVPTAMPVSRDGLLLALVGILVGLGLATFIYLVTRDR